MFIATSLMDAYWVFGPFTPPLYYCCCSSSSFSSSLEQASCRLGPVALFASTGAPPPPPAPSSHREGERVSMTRCRQ
eukprot:3549460-Pyramimonas_sp.AAC.1